jgi:hypothetical protein
VLYAGPYDRAVIEQAFTPHREVHEGYVLRWADAFSYTEFERAVGKWVRANHVQTSDHWLFQPVVVNQRKAD